MRQFVLRQNIARFQRALDAEHDEMLCRPIREMLSASRRELALLDAASVGAQAAPAGPGTDRPWRTHAGAALFRDEFDDSPHPCMVLDPRPGLMITDLNAAHFGATHTGRDAIGRPLFEAFPDDPGNPEADGVGTLYAMLRAAAESGLPQSRAAHRYDVRTPDGCFATRYWRTEIMPLMDDGGRLLFLLHKAKNITAEAMAL